VPSLSGDHGFRDVANDSPVRAEPVEALLFFKRKKEGMAFDELRPNGLVLLLPNYAPHTFTVEAS
jgi:hypothetical protein